jgi:hypothetical protein
MKGATYYALTIRNAPLCNNFPFTLAKRIMRADFGHPAPAIRPAINLSKPLH